jgi:hypothetical protein
VRRGESDLEALRLARRTSCAQGMPWASSARARASRPRRSARAARRGTDRPRQGAPIVRS